MKIHFYGKSDIGRVRSTNEDCFSSKKISDTEYLFIIADGMGGHQAGEVASKLGTDTFVREYKKSRKKKTGIEESMVHSLKKSNASILKRSLTDPMKRGMGTTFTAMVIADKKATIVHVGDSRIYLIRGNKIKKITTDHTFVEKMLLEGRINEQEARDHPQKNILYQSLGAREIFSPEIIRDTEIKRGDIITMCSDGLNNMVDDQEIKKYAQQHDPEDAVNELIRRANEKGGNDNITVQIIQTGKTGSRKGVSRKGRKHG
jgi:protein phosphatase